MCSNKKKIEYSGSGTAIGPEHGITLYGIVKAEFYENGRVAVEMEVERQEVNGTFVFSGTYGQFPELKVAAVDGTFITHDVTVALKKLTMGDKPGTLVAFFSNESVFLPKSGEGLKARYWKIFLTNCISNFMTPRPDLDTHPLSRKNKWKICFKYRGKDVFIEALDDYDERVMTLKEEKDACVTATMIGDVENDDDLSNYQDWLPLDITFLLGLATGNSIGIAYIEFFDEKGTLVKRVHPRFVVKKFMDLESVIYEGWHRGTEELLTKAFLFEKDVLHLISVLINQFLAAIESHYLEDQLAGLLQGLDGLFLDKKLIENLEPESQKDVLEILNSLAKSFDNQIEELKKMKELTTPLTITEKETLESFRQKVKELPRTNEGFSRQFAHLLAANGLLDCDVLKDSKFTINNYQGLKWLELVNKYRNKVTHGEVIPTKDFEFVTQLIKHIEDIFVRIVFIKIGYTGKYQPRVATSILMDKTSEWITAETQPKDFGYERWLL